jgi:hypothetical protein
LVQKQARHAKLDTLLMYDRRDNELKVGDAEACASAKAWVDEMA